MCCRSTYMQQNGALEMYLRQSACVCNGAACTSECAAATCASPPGFEQTCPPCLDGLLQAHGCDAGIAACEADQGCKAMADCVEGCL
jgi:hypothetical protein